MDESPCIGQPDCAFLMDSLDRLGFGYYRSDATGRIVAVNVSGARIYGYRPEEMVEGVTTFETNVSPEEREQMTRLLERDGHATCKAVPGRHRSGRTLFVDVSIQVLRGPGGEVAGYEGVFADVTDSVHSERNHAEPAEELRRTIDHLGRLAVFQEEFLAALSHDLQTPPVVILGMSELLLRGHYGPLREAQEKSLRTIHRNVLHFSRMMEQLLQFSRLINGRPRCVPPPVPVQESLERALEEVRSEWEGTFVRCSVEVASEPLLVAADTPSLDFLVKNLLQNGGAFLRPGFEMEGSLSEDGGKARLRVAVEPLRPNVPLPSRLLKKFFILPEKGGEERGAELPIGLAAGAYVAKLLHGDLQAEAAGTSGLRITLTLPLAREGGEGEDYAEAPKKAERARRPRTAKAKAAKIRSRSRK